MAASYLRRDKCRDSGCQLAAINGPAACTTATGSPTMALSPPELDSYISCIAALGNHQLLGYVIRDD